MDAARTTFKGVVQKSAEAIEDLIGNKTAVKFTSLGKSKSKEKEDEREEIYIPRKKKTANYRWLEIVLRDYIK